MPPDGCPIYQGVWEEPPDSEAGGAGGRGTGNKGEDGDTVAAAWMKGVPKERPCWGRTQETREVQRFSDRLPGAAHRWP